MREVMIAMEKRFREDPLAHGPREINAARNKRKLEWLRDQYVAPGIQGLQYQKDSSAVLPKLREVPIFERRVVESPLLGALRAERISAQLSPSGEPFNAQETFAQVRNRIANQPEFVHPNLAKDISQLPRTPLK